MTEAERYRIIHQMLTNSKAEGGAGITPKEGEWKNVESIFLLHDVAFNKKWVRDWSLKTFLSVEDLDEIRNRLGEKVMKTFELLGTTDQWTRLASTSLSPNLISLS